MKLLQKIIESIVLFFSGNLIRLSFATQLSWVDNMILFITAIAVLSLIFINQIIREKEKEVKQNQEHFSEMD